MDNSPLTIASCLWVITGATVSKGNLMRPSPQDVDFVSKAWASEKEEVVGPSIKRFGIQTPRIDRKNLVSGSQSLFLCLANHVEHPERGGCRPFV
ncbi:hypothetical protein HPB52_003241 [Rhipicephalus sanguineus]|uniref:Uncharacterized protein n=1 Tax=Rhipicephalus sanguineus TaxID=34632 RepID=A0A9D4PYL4_RHISA|nr:hypothetical protein HPB52_003241 [Rhipicephalus sanguineus]